MIFDIVNDTTTCSISLVWLVSQHERTLLSFSIKSIKATSMLKRLDCSFALVIRGGPRFEDIHHHPVQSADE